MAHSSDDLIRHTHNTSRFFVEQRLLGWAALVAVTAWGTFGYFAMPQRKDPEIPTRVAVASCPWPGATAAEVEQLVTRPIEQTVAENKTVHPPAADAFGIRSLTLPGASFVYVQLAEDVTAISEQFSDINLKLEALNARLPQGAGPIQFQSGFGDTAALMMTVASPPVDALEIDLRAKAIEEAIRRARGAAAPATTSRVSIVFGFPLALSETAMAHATDDFRRTAETAGVLDHSVLVSGRGFMGVDAGSALDDAHVGAFLNGYLTTRLQQSEFDPDLWVPVVIRDPARTREMLAKVAGWKYSYAELDDFTDLVGRTLLGVPQTSRVDRKGIQPQAIYLEYSQERLASYGLNVTDLSRVLSARNITLSGGSLEAGGRNILLNPSGEFEDARAIGDVLAGGTSGMPVYLRDLVSISRGYQSPATYLNYYSWLDKNGQFRRSRAITLAVYMRSGEQIKAFGQNIEEKMRAVRAALPADLIVARTSDQPSQVEENIDLFMDALYEAIVLVVLVALVGFWEWRSALLMALSMPITLAMTFGMVHTLHIDLQQVSIATLIIALGLLVDDPVVANDAIKRELSQGQSRLNAAWIGPTKLARAILYATATNIIAYLPFLMLKGSTGEFLYSLPVVMTAALVASRIASMTFIPLLGYYLLRQPRRAEPTLEERRTRGFTGFYYRLAGSVIAHRWLALAVAILFLVGGGLVATRLKSQFFPEDVQYLSYADVWLPNDAPLSATNAAAGQVEQVIRRVVGEYEARTKRDHAVPLLTAVTSFVGGGGPRFWFSVSPEQQQKNYAQVVIQLSDKTATPPLVAPLQAALTAEVPGAVVTLHELQTNPVEYPVEIRLSSVSDVDPRGEEGDNENLHRLAGEVQDILRPLGGVQVVMSDWLDPSPEVALRIDNDRANMAGITNRDIAASTAAATSGSIVTMMREGNHQIPVIARLRSQERAQLSDLANLYVSASQGSVKVPLRSVASLDPVMQTVRIRRQDHFRTVGVHAFPQPGVLPSEVLAEAKPQLDAFVRRLPSAYRLQIGGEQAKQEAGFANLVQVLVVSLIGIYAALLLQFNNPVKPLLVLAAAPFGVIGALVALVIMGSPFGFMAFLGITSLIGVIVSHVIVLFDFIEEMHERGETFEQAIRDAGIERLRPVLVTVGATILALFPLALHGGPLWKPLCYTQIGGLAVATFITLLLVPVLYSIAVLDLKIVKWDRKGAEGTAGSSST